MSTSTNRLLFTQSIYVVIAVAGIGVVAAALLREDIGVKDLATAVLALLGTYLGATLAFRLNQDKEERRAQANRKEALNRALFVLSRQFNAVYQLKRDYDRYGEAIQRAFALPALKPPSYIDLVHNFVDLEFLLESDDPDLLFRLTIEQERFHQAIESVRIRNEFYVNEFQPKMAEVGLNGRMISIDDAKIHLGDRIFGAVTNGTTIAYDHLSACNQSMPEVQAQLLAFAKRSFPGKKFVSYEARDA